MTDNTTLDAAIRAYNKTYDVPDDWPIRDADRQAFRTGVAELLRGMKPPAWFSVEEDSGFDFALAEIRRRANIEGDK
jgi:hypothetical protein